MGRPRGDPQSAHPRLRPCLGRNRVRGPVRHLPILYELWVFRRWRSRRRAVSRARIADQPDQNARIRCVGLREEFDESGELHDVNFEPQLFYAGLCAPLSPAGTLRFFIVSAVALLLIAIFRTASSVPFGFWFAAYS